MYRTLSRVLLGASLLLSSLSFSHAQNLLGIDYESGMLYNISTATAALTPVASTGIANFADIQYAPNGTLYGFTTTITSGNTTTPATLYTINPTTGQATPVGPLGLSLVTEGGLTITPDGKAYGTCYDKTDLTQDLFSIDLATGVGTDIGTMSGGFHDINSIAYRSDGMLIGVDGTTGTNSLLLINPNTAAVSTISVFSQKIGAAGGMVIINGQGYFNSGGPNPIFPGTNSLYTLDPFTGANTLIGSFSPTITGIGISGITAPFAATPEPGSVALMVAFGVGGAGFLARRKKTRKSSR